MLLCTCDRLYFFKSSGVLLKLIWLKESEVKTDFPDVYLSLGFPEIQPRASKPFELERCIYLILGILESIWNLILIVKRGFT